MHLQNFPFELCFLSSLLFSHFLRSSSSDWVVEGVPPPPHTFVTLSSFDIVITFIHSCCFGLLCSSVFVLCFTSVWSVWFTSRRIATSPKMLCIPYFNEWIMCLNAMDLVAAFISFRFCKLFKPPYSSFQLSSPPYRNAGAGNCTIVPIFFASFILVNVLNLQTKNAWNINLDSVIFFFAGWLPLRSVPIGACYMSLQIGST